MLSERQVKLRWSLPRERDAVELAPEHGFQSAMAVCTEGQDSRSRGGGSVGLASPDAGLEWNVGFETAKAAEKNARRCPARPPEIRGADMLRRPELRVDPLRGRRLRGQRETGFVVS